MLNGVLRQVVLLAMIFGLALPEAWAQFTTIINVPPDVAPSSIGSDTQLNLMEGGTIGILEAGANDGSSVNVEVNMSGGSLLVLDAWSGSTINVTNGEIDNLRLYEGSTFNLNNGLVLDDFLAYGGELNITGGSTGAGMFGVFKNTIMDISGGTLNGEFLWNDSQVIFSGGTLQGELEANSSSFHVSGGSIGDNFALGTSGQESSLSMTGGAIGESLNIQGSFEMSGGSIGNQLRVTSEIEPINITGGTIGDDSKFTSYLINMSGGTIGENAEVTRNLTTLNLAGGSIGDGLIANSNGLHLNIFGTQFVLDGVDITDTLTINQPTMITDREVDLSGVLAEGSSYNFFLPLPYPPEPGLVDSQISSENAGVPGINHIAPLLQELHLIRVEPGDFNMKFPEHYRDPLPPQDVDGADFLHWQRGLANYLAPDDLADWELNFGHLSDFDGDGDTDGADFLEWQRGLTQPYYMNNRLDWEANFGSPPSPSTAAIVSVPEPSAALLFLVGLVFTSVRRMHRQT